MTTDLFRRFTVAMSFVAVAVLDRELHKASGVAAWRLANSTDAACDRVAANVSLRSHLLRRRATMLGASAICLRRSRSLIEESRLLLSDKTSHPGQRLQCVVDSAAARPT